MKLVHVLDERRSEFGTFRLQLLIELYSGLRMGEINALRPEDLNFRKGFLHIGRTVSCSPGGGCFIKDGTKTKAGIRDVPISRPLEDVLRQALDTMNENPEGLIFYDHAADRVYSTAQVCKVYKKACRIAGITYSGQHALRHTFATRCIEAGVEPVVLKSWLGHTNIHITLDTYADVFDRMNLGAISKFESFMDELMKNVGGE